MNGECNRKNPIHLKIFTSFAKGLDQIFVGHGKNSGVTEILYENGSQKRESIFFLEDDMIKKNQNQKQKNMVGKLFHRKLT